MRIIFVNRYYAPDQSATSRMVTSLASALAARGHAVSVLASRHFHDKREFTLPTREVIDGVPVHRIATSGFGRGRLAGRALDYASFHASAAAWLLAKARRGDVAILCTDPPLLSVTAALPLKLRGARLVNWVMDLFPEVAIDIGLMAETHPAARMALSLRDLSHRAAALNVCPIGTMARHLEARGIPSDRLATVHHWSEGNEIFPVAPVDNRLRAAWGLSERFVVGYSGNFGRAHDFSAILDAASRLRDDPSIAFLLIGEGQQKGEVEGGIAARGLENVIMKPLQPRAVLAESLSAADVHLVSLRPQLERSVIPSKLYGILAAGRPALFLGDPAGEVATVLAGARCGLTVGIDDGAGLADAIRRLKDDPVERAAMAANARRTFEDGYTRECGVAAWSEVLASLEEAGEATRKPEAPRSAGRQTSPAGAPVAAARIIKR